jgi:hypothetical protein
VPALTAFCARIIQDVANGVIDPEVGRVVLTGINVQRHLVVAGEHEARIAALESGLTPRRATR